MKSNIIDCAYYLIFLFKTKYDDIDSAVAKLKLYKLLFLTDAYYLVLNDEAMFKEDWVYDFFGPRTKELSKEFDWHGAMDISIMFDEYELEEKIANITNEEKVYLEYIYKTFGKYSSFDLTSLVHFDEILDFHKDDLFWEENLGPKQIKNWFLKTYPFLILN